MSQMEAFIWTKFLEENGSNYYDYNYDFHLVKPIKLPTDYPDEYRRNAIALSSLRIDVVMRDKDQIYIAEIRPNAKQSAIGNLISYRFLYMMQENPTQPVKMMLVTNLYDPAVELSCRAIEIIYNVY
jgi:hypothetical protein